MVPRVVCDGALTGTVEVRDVVDLAAVARTGADYKAFDEVRHDRAIAVGDAAVMEARCSAADGTEIGYALVRGNLISAPDHSYGGRTLITPPAAAGHALPTGCLAPVEARGNPPCVEEPMVVSWADG